MQIQNKEQETDKASMIQEPPEQNNVLRMVLHDIVRIIGGQNIEEDDIQLLTIPKVVKQNIAIDTIYYAGCFADELNANLNELQENRTTLNEFSCFSGIKKTYIADETKEYSIQCLLLNEAADYYGILKYILAEIVKEAKYGELIRKNLLDGLMQKNSFDDRAILMGKYTRKFLRDNGMPSEELLIELSAQRYEGSESEARIYVEADCPQQHNEIFAFDSSGDSARRLESGKLRTIRKLMEISKRKALQLLANRELCITGLISIADGEQEETDKKSNYICFSGYMQWSVYIKGKEEICYKQGKYYINSSAGRDIYAGKVCQFKNKIGARLNQDIIARIENLVETLKDQRHGTTVIITDDQNEPIRLCGVGRGILVEAEKEKGFMTEDNRFDREKLLSITGIDGALFLDLQGKCTAVGVIVDGVAEVSGDIGRGARYNSIYNYIYQKRERGSGCKESRNNGKIYVALIFSEDGGVDIIDNLTISAEETK